MKNNTRIIFITITVIFGTWSFAKTSNDETVGDSTTSIGKGPGTYIIASDNKEITIPFEIYRNDIRLNAQINNIDCHILIDNGSLWDELLFFGSPKVDSLQFEITNETFIGDSTVPNPIVADVTSNISIDFGDVVFHEQTAIITRYIKDLPNIWEGADGQISAAFFNHFVVEINFDEAVIRLTPPKQFKYEGDGIEINMIPGPFNSRTITADIVMPDNSEFSIDLLIDLGGIYPLYLPIGRDSRIKLPENAIETVLGRGLSGPINGYLADVKEIIIGVYSIKNIQTAFTPVDKNDSIYGNTMIGMPLLQSFNVIFDYFNERMILEPIKSQFHK